MTPIFENPFRGPFSFKEDDEDIFFGRTLEVEELVNLIRKHQLTVLYGASGTGKTSLIHAKLLPQLKREYFHPIYIRINFANKDEDPLVSVQRRIVEELKIWDQSIPDFTDGQSLIDYAAKNVIFKGLIKPVLFFDQFEELFTLGHKSDPFKLHRFMFQLSELIELRLPDALKTVDYINNISSFKVVFSLRQDWIGFLDDFTLLIPSINDVRYRLKRFSPSQALDAIICPSQSSIKRKTAELIIKTIGTPALWRDDGVVSGNVDKDLVNKEVDPFVLSIYCFQLFKKSHQKQLSEVTPEFVEEHNDTQLIRHYYEESIEKYPELRYLIENKLLNESGKRLTITIDKFAGNDEYLRKLAYQISENTGIIRVVGKEADSEIEIVHDRLAKQIFESKTERIAREIHEEASKIEKQAIDLKKSATKAKKITLTIGVVASLIIISLAIFIFRIYINFVNDKTAQGLEKQLNASKLAIQFAKDSITQLNNLITNNKPIPETVKVENLAMNEQAIKDYNITIKRQKKSLDSFFQVGLTLREDLQALIDKTNYLSDQNEELEKNLSSANAELAKLNANTAIKSLPKIDISNFKILNMANPDGSISSKDIKQSGYKFSFDIPTIQNSEDGWIRVKVLFNNGKYPMDEVSLQSLKFQGITKTFTIKNDKLDVFNNTSPRYFVYYVDKKTGATTDLLHGVFTIKKPPTEIQ
ncbi:MAG: ATP-binding protein [Bacteroidetes bacterium]|nr:ATP-binding protein [Bacteroidota bacterium]